MKVKTGQKEAYALDNGANEKQSMVGNYLPSSISQRVWPANHISPIETEMNELRKSQTRLSQLVCILATALILSSFISATFIVLFMTGLATSRSDGEGTSSMVPPFPFFLPPPDGQEMNRTDVMSPFGEEFGFPVEPAQQREAPEGRRRTATTSQVDLRYNKLVALSNQEYLTQVLETIAIPRPVNSRNHAYIQNVITSSMESADWTVTKDTFRQWIPYRGSRTFTNIIATLNPLAPYRLVLACHYDSKLTTFQFSAATDSAAPCTILLNMAKFMTPLLRLEPSKMQNTTLQMIFFDGEEAFNRWSATDSLYGSRHLAELWATQDSLPAPGKKVIDTIDLFVLLDLLGQEGRMSIQNYFQNTAGRYRELQKIEKDLSSKGLLLDHCNSNNKYFKATNVQTINIEDDHLPFMRRGVKIVHLIPYPFPSVWHTRNDDISAIDMNTLDNFSRIMNVFVADYFGLTTLPETSKK